MLKKSYQMTAGFTNATLESVGGRMKSERHRLGLTQEDLSERLSLSRQSVAAYEAGRSPSDVKYLTQLGALGADIIFVLTGRRGDQVAEDLFDWEVATDVMAAIEEAAEKVGVTLTPKRRMGLLKFLYGKSSDTRYVDRDDVAGALELFAGT
jgi:transcriptional regulator with XRE-family HTH domain